MLDRFEEVLKSLGEKWDLPLHPDKNQACKLRMGEACEIQMEYRQERQALLIATFVIELPPGKFRENLLKTALKRNCKEPQTARLSYSDKNNQLALFQFIPVENLSGQMLYEMIEIFAAKVVLWKKGVETGDLGNL